MSFTFQKMTQAHFNFEHELRPPDDFSSLEESQDVLQQKIPSSSFTTDVPQLEVSSVSPPLSLTQDVHVDIQAITVGVIRMNPVDNVESYPLSSAGGQPEHITISFLSNNVCLLSS